MTLYLIDVNVRNCPHKPFSKLTKSQNDFVPSDNTTVWKGGGITNKLTDLMALAEFAAN